jgi:antirestriction protein
VSEIPPTAHESPNEHEQEPRQQPRIYVASLSDYNAGRLHGTWIDAVQPAEDLWICIGQMLASSPEPIAEEWAIHDYESFGALRLSEYESIERVSEIGLGIAEHGLAFAAWASHLERNEWDRLSQFEECYMGQWASTTEYAENILESFGLWQAIEEAVPEPLQPYIHPRRCRGLCARPVARW